MIRTAVSRDALHSILWDQSARGGKIVVSTGELAERLGVYEKVMSRVLTEMVDAGRLKVITRRKGASATYVVIDPRAWFAEHGMEEPDE